MFSTCHSVVVSEEPEPGEFNASSPDELALVKFATEFRFKFKGWSKILN